MKRKWVALFLCFTTLITVFAGCGAKKYDSEYYAKLIEVEDNKDTVVSDNKEKKQDLITVGFTQVGAESDWRIANTESMKSALSEENGFKLVFNDAQQKQENQIKAVEDFIAQGVDAIVIAPVTENGWDDVLGKAKAAGIPVILVDRMVNVSDDSLYTCWIGSNFEAEGVSAANWLNDYLKAQGKGTKKQNVVVIQGTMGSSAEIGRTKGFKDTVSKLSNINILEQQCGDFTQAKGQEVMENFLKKYKDIDVVVSQNDNMSFGAIDAIKAVGKKPGKVITIVSFDAVKAAFVSMIDGDMNVSVECNPLHGPKVAELIKNILNGKTVDKVQYIDEAVYSQENAEAKISTRQY